MIEIPELYIEPQQVPSTGSATLLGWLVAFVVLIATALAFLHFSQRWIIRRNRAIQRSDRLLLKALDRQEDRTELPDKHAQELFDNALTLDPNHKRLLSGARISTVGEAIWLIRQEGFEARRRSLLDHDSYEPAKYQLSYQLVPTVILAIMLAAVGLFGAHEYVKLSDDQLKHDAGNIQDRNDEAIRSVEDQIASTYGDTTQLQDSSDGHYAVDHDDFVSAITKEPREGKYESVTIALRLDDGTVVEDARLISQSSDEPTVNHTVHIEIPDNGSGSDDYRRYIAGHG